MELNLNFHLDNTNNLYLTSIEEVENGYEYDSIQKRLTLPSIIRVGDQNQDVYTTYSIHDCAFYGVALSDLNKLKIRQCVLNIGNYAFTKSSINTLEIFSVVPPTFAPKAFEGWPQNDIAFTVICCKGLRPIYEAVLNKFITNGQITLIENDYILETRNYIPYLDYAGDTLEAIEYQAELVEIKPTAYLGHRFTLTPSDNTHTKVQFLEPDDVYGAKPLAQDYYEQITDSNTNFNYLYSLVANRPGIIAFGAGQKGSLEMPTTINLNILKNGLYNANYQNEHTIEFSGYKLEDFAFQQDNNTKEKINIKIQFNILKEMSSNCFRGMNINYIQPLEEQEEVLGACYRAICLNDNVISLTQRGQNADYIVHYDDKGIIDQLIWARKNISLDTIINTLEHEDFNQIKSIPSYCFYLEEKINNKISIFTVPDNIEYIGSYAFQNYTINTLLTNVTRNKRLIIEDYALMNSDLETIVSSKYIEYTLLIDGTNKEKYKSADNALQAKNRIK